MKSQVFEQYRYYLQSYRNEAIKAFKKKQAKIAEAKETYKNSVLPQKIQDIENEFQAEIKALKERHTSAIKANTIAQTSNNRLHEPLDLELLTEINAVSASGVVLTAKEIESYGERALKSRNRIVAGAVKGLADKSGYNLELPDEQKAIDIAENAKDYCLRIIDNFYGDTATNGISGEQIDYRVSSNGSWLDRVDKEYSKYSTEQIIVVLRKTPDGEKTKEVEIFDTTNTAKEKTGTAAEYARKRSSLNAGIEVSGYDDL